MSFTSKSPKTTYKDLLYVDNSNNGVGTTAKKVLSGDGSTSSVKISDRHLQVTSNTNNTTAFEVHDRAGNTMFVVDTTNDLVKALGHNVNTQYKFFGMYDMSPADGVHHPLIVNPIMYDSATWGAGAMNGANWGSNGTNPVLSLTVASGSKTYSAVVWILQDNITIDEVAYIMTADGSASANLHLMQYNVVTGSGSTAGDLSSGVVLAQTGSASDSLSPITIGDDRASNGTLTINQANVDGGKAIVAFVEETDGTDDISVQLSLKYHLR